MGMTLPVYIGFDAREQPAYWVAESSLQRHASIPVHAIPLEYQRLASCGLLRRPQDRRGHTYDIISNANQSTDFAVSRFLVPHLCQSGWALFVDSDVVFMADVAELMALADPLKAVMVVQHPLIHEMGLLQPTKMDGQLQSFYMRKNWSSVMLFNCDHPANRRLSLQDVNERPGRDLHAFYWLADNEIGELPPAWNWLVGLQAKPALPCIAHFTLGGPFLPNWKSAEHDDLWFEASKTS